MFALPQQKSKNPEELRNSIKLLVNELEQHPKQVFKITDLSNKYNIPRRRLYDVINVFSALGVCQRAGLDHMIWNGTSCAMPVLNTIKSRQSINDKAKSLSSIFPVNACIGIANLTLALISAFYALKISRLDIRFIAHLFSRGTSRYKTTLCKLYQICYVLSSVGMTSRTATVCEIEFNKPYFNCDTLPDIDDHNQLLFAGPLCISNLLNHYITIAEEDQYIYDRRKELKDLFIESVTSKNLPEVELKLD